MAKLLIRAIWKWPQWLLEVFSWGKSFKNNPIIGSYWLNLCGLHVARVVLAQVLFRFRLLLLAPLVPAADRRDFLKKGYILKENFLPQDEFQRLRQALQDYRGEVRELVEGTTLTQRTFMTRAEREKLPALKAFADDPRLDHLMRYCSSKNRPPLFYVENLCNHANVVPRPDPQRDMHADTFHPCVKGWLYIDSVDDDNGPYIYVPGSHRLTWRRLKWEYRQSLEACKRGQARAPGRYWDGSFRVSEQALREMGLAPVKFCVPANTLLIANVYGFHRRGEAERRSNRMTVWMQARDNPFNPLFTLWPATTGRVFEWVWGQVLRRLDGPRQAAGEQRVFCGGFSRE
ncbi:phytanoyl-CoA dioxygenase family protein [Microbulbifer thermotolerans]|uniref:phytanoyl-CoA dioxygenase family protein n=1 Tax=Microbulbifer thermotolerans TaxID=252514 RepID=UPI0022492DEA|nr:phytanoyl-CoA dioxygenase family protein [Microbulbifer thermotolerans]MCX2831516.1 phytanoyl-CoA dioxygenase family protein [Microbulbifer thermotolerans]MCX2842899.1 phytanoyl-CoA dioxygenase family protein [Microbulbifer thermotolerans]